MPKRKARSKFERWVREIGGTRKLSIILDCSQSTVQHWLSKRSSPSVEFCEKILKIADGKISISDLLKGHK
jgi:hypothetical protein